MLLRSEETARHETRKDSFVSVYRRETLPSIHSHYPKSKLRRELKDTGLNEKYFVRGLLLEMEPLSRIDYSGRYDNILTEFAKAQRTVPDALNPSNGS